MMIYQKQEDMSYTVIVFILVRLLMHVMHEKRFDKPKSNLENKPLSRAKST